MKNIKISLSILIFLFSILSLITTKTNSYKIIVGNTNFIDKYEEKNIIKSSSILDNYSYASNEAEKNSMFI